jgi:hypothetical protein
VLYSNLALISSQLAWFSVDFDKSMSSLVVESEAGSWGREQSSAPYAANALKWLCQYFLVALHCGIR